jgi:hypothetical protein
VHDVEQGFVDLADVVKERDTFHGSLKPLVEAGRLGENERGRRYPAHMKAGFLIIGFDCIEQRLERCGGKSFERALPAMLAICEPCSGGQTNGEWDAWIHSRPKSKIRAVANRS